MRVSTKSKIKILLAGSFSICFIHARLDRVVARAVTITELPHHRGNEMPTAVLRSSPHFFARYLQEESRGLHSVGPDQISCDAVLNSRIKHVAVGNSGVI